MFTLQSLHIYPVKSARGIDVNSVSLDRFGPQGDRRWMLVQPDGNFVTQRNMPMLTGLTVALRENGLELYYDGERCSVEIPAAATPRFTVHVWGDQVSALDGGELVADWLERCFGEPLRLVYMPDSARRPVDPDYARRGETVSFADGFPLLLISDAAGEALNEKLEQAVTLERFRPNIVVAGCAAHAEDDWRQIRIGEVEFSVVKACTRCQIPALHPHTGEKHPNLLRVLAAYRRGDDRQVTFGQNLLYEGGGTLRVGDPVEVLA
ncbi:MAG: MOSC N-terminal beta barrel domain-containing protein [Pseudomonadota bacterium]